MDQAVVRFVQTLRHRGLPVSPAETLDALQAVAALGVDNRQRLKTAIAMTLAKTPAHREVLENLFDDFFVLQCRGDDGTKRAGISTAGHHLQSVLGRQLLNDEHAALHRAMIAAGDSAGIRDMKIFLQQNRVTARILAALGDRELQQELHELAAGGQHPALVADLGARRQQLVDRIRDYVERQYLLFSGNQGQLLAEDTLLRVRLKNIDHLQQQQMARLVAKVASRLARLHSRRRKVSNRGMLDVRRTLAANAAFDGHLFITRWKATRIERPRVMVICDISPSVSQVAGFFLLFIHSLQAVLPRVRSFVFSSELVEVTNAFKAYDLETALNVIIEQWGNRATDYGRALADFSDHALRDVDHRTQIIMVGDARNNFDTGRVDLWQTLCNRAQRVLWLNPEERSRWNSGDSMMREYGVYCSMVEQCSSLRDMERILGRLLKYAL